MLETLEQVKTAEPVPPSRLVPGLPRDVETIALKCLQKDPAQAVRVGRGAGRGPAAVPGRRADPGAAGRARRAGLAVVPAQPGAGLSLGVVDRRAADRDGDRLLLRGPARGERRALAMPRAERSQAESCGGETTSAASTSHSASASATTSPGPWSCSTAAPRISGAGSGITPGASVTSIWAPSANPGQSLNGVAFSPDGTRVASVSGAFILDEPAKKGDLVVRDVATGQEIFAHRDVASGFRGVAFSPDGRWIATGNASDLVIWDAATGKEEFRLTDPGNRDLPLLSLALARTAGGSSRDTGDSTSPRSSATPISGI